MPRAARTMAGGGREKKSKVTKRSKLAVAAASAEAEADGAVWQPKPSKRDQFLKSADDTLYLGGAKQKSKRRPVVVEDEFELEENGPLARRGAAWQPPQGETPLDGSALFVRWEEMLGSREALKRRLDAIAAVHGWESRCARRSFLGGIEPGVLARSLRVEIDEFGQAAAELERADLLLQLRRVRTQLTSRRSARAGRRRAAAGGHLARSLQHSRRSSTASASSAAASRRGRRRE